MLCCLWGRQRQAEPVVAGEQRRSGSASRQEIWTAQLVLGCGCGGTNLLPAGVAPGEGGDAPAVPDVESSPTAALLPLPLALLPRPALARVVARTEQRGALEAGQHQQQEAGPHHHADRPAVHSSTVSYFC